MVHDITPKGIYSIRMDLDEPTGVENSPMRSPFFQPRGADFFDPLSNGEKEPGDQLSISNGQSETDAALMGISSSPADFPMDIA